MVSGWHLQAEKDARRKAREKEKRAERKATEKAHKVVLQVLRAPSPQPTPSHSQCLEHFLLWVEVQVNDDDACPWTGISVRGTGARKCVAWDTFCF